MKGLVLVRRSLLCVLFTWIVPLAVAAQPSGGGGDRGGDGSQPSGGGYGCVANGNCKMTNYKDEAVRSKWWYPLCSGCHQISRVANPRRPEPNEFPLVASQPARFWRFHEASTADRHWQPQLQEFRRPIDARRLSADFRTLMSAQPRQ